jgi:hypothetical protein
MFNKIKTWPIYNVTNVKTMDTLLTCAFKPNKTGRPTNNNKEILNITSRRLKRMYKKTTIKMMRKKRRFVKIVDTLEGIQKVPLVRQLKRSS